jgi:hypothetical protein
MLCVDWTQMAQDEAQLPAVSTSNTALNLPISQPSEISWPINRIWTPHKGFYSKQLLQSQPWLLKILYFSIILCVRKLFASFRCHTKKYGYTILSSVLLTIDGVWFGLVNRLIDHLQDVIANKSTLLLISTLQITPRPVFSVCFHKSLLCNSTQQWLFLCSVFTRRFLITSLNNWDCGHVLIPWLPLPSWTPVNCQLTGYQAGGHFTPAS